MIVNNDNYLIKEFPKFHPISQRYERIVYWRDIKRKCIEGMWVSGKWMPGSLFFYSNMHTIRFEDESGTSRKIGRPWLRDIDWEKAYIYEEACGFSGFSEDYVHTCDRRYGPEKERALYFGWITQEELKLRKYVPAREYLRWNHGKDMGKPLYRNQAKNVLDLECFGPGTMVLMYDGTTRAIEDIRVGDKVMGPDSKPRKVLSTHSGVDQMYEIKSKRFDSYTCNSRHTMAIQEREYINGKYVNGVRENGTYKIVQKNISLAELLSKQDQSSFENRYYIYQSDEIEFGYTSCKIDPYFLGYWLADGRSNTISLKSVDKDVVDNLDFGNREVREYLSPGNRQQVYELVWLKKDNKDLYEYMREVLYNKHIPQSYKTSPIGERLKLLAGIIDGYGCYDSFDVYVGINKKLAEDICFVARSCGFYSNITKRVRKGLQDTYEVIISGDIWNIPTKYHRKKAKEVERRINVKRSSFQIQPVGEGTFYGIEVDGDNLFLLDNFLVVHNSRGGGKSYLAASQIISNFLFDGATDYDVYLHNKKNATPFTSDTVVGAIESKYSTDLLNKVKLSLEHLPDKRMINNEIYPSPLFIETSGSLASGKTLTSSVGSVVNHRTFMDDPLAANGTRPNRAFLEEVGFMNNVVEVWGAIEATQASADHKSLVIYGLGTGGLTSKGAAQYVKDIYYNPEEYNCLSFDDQWENRGKIGFFLPAAKTINKFKKGPDLITDEKLAQDYVDMEVANAKASNNNRKYMATVINMPSKPSDIFLTIEGNYFPTEELKIIHGDLEANKRLLQASWKVHFIILEGKVDWRPSDKPVLKHFPHKRGDVLDTAIEIWELPKTDESGKPPYGRYIAALDPVDNDGGDDVDHSLMSGFIMDSWTDTLVLEYTGRTKMTSDFYEQWRRALIYYNALCNYERNLKGFYPYMKHSNSLHYLCEEPEILKERGLVGTRAAIGNQLKGTHCTTPIINWGLDLILHWLAESAYNQAADQLQEGERMEQNMHRIRSLALLEELISYSSQINADRVSALVLLMVLREDRLQITRGSNMKQHDDIRTHSFWNRAYSNKKFYRGA